MKSKEELNALKEEVETQNKQRRELTDGELEQVSGGAFPKNEVIQEVISIDDTGIVSANAVR